MSISVSRRRIGPTRRIAAVALAFSLAAPAAVQWTADAVGQDRITTVAGGPGAGPALAVGQSPAGLAVVGTGLYVSDNVSQVVRRIDTTDPTRRESVFAGNGSGGFSGDGGPATSAQMATPAGMASDAAGNLYIADSSNNRVRRVSAAGVITTIAGQGTANYGGDGGPATMALLNAPSGVAVSGDNLYIADTNNHRVRKVVLSTGVITTAAGLPLGAGGGAAGGDGGPATLAQLASPTGLAVDPAGNLFIADTAHNLIRRVDNAGVITTVAGSSATTGYTGDGGQATAAKLNNPRGVAIDGNGRLLIADTLNHAVRRVGTDGVISTLAGTGTSGYGQDDTVAVAARLKAPQGVASSGTDVIVADTGNLRIRVVDPAGTITTLAGNGQYNFGGDDGPATDAQLAFPSGVAVAPDGGMFLADTNNNRIRRVDAGGTMTTVVGTGAVCPPPNDAGCGDGGPAPDALVTRPAAVAVGADGLYIAANNRVRRIGTDGNIVAVAGTGSYGSAGDGGPAVSATMFQPSGLVLDTAGNLFIADTSNNRVRRVDALSGVITTVAGGVTPPAVSVGDNAKDGSAATAAPLKYPAAVTFDDFGNLFIADSGQQRVRMVAPGTDGRVTGAADEIISTVVGQGTASVALGDGGPATAASLGAPSGLAFREGDMLITDSSLQRLRKVTAGADGKVTGEDDEIITTLAGDGSSGYSGDGGPPAGARLASPRGVDVTPDGRVVIADYGNNRIRSVQAAAVEGLPTIVASGGGAQRTEIGTEFPVPLEATVRNSRGQTVQGVEVTFTAPSTGPSGRFQDGTVSARATTDASGTATAPAFSANARAGSYQVTAAADGYTGQPVYPLVNDHGPAVSAAATAGTPQTARAGEEFPTRFEVMVLDFGDNPVPGVTVTFTAPDDGPSGTFDTAGGGTSRSVSATTADDGRATASAFVADPTPGSYTVAAVVDGVFDPVAFALTNAAEHTPVLTALAGTPQSTRVGTAFPEALVVSARDENDDPLVDEPITFTAPATGPSGTFAGGATEVTVATDAEGRATAPALTANSTAGSWTLPATMPGDTAPAMFSLGNASPFASSIRAIGGTPQSTDVGTSFDRPLLVLVRDDAGNPFAGAQVRFAAPETGPTATFEGGTSTALATTDTRGIAASPPLTAGDEDGDYAVVAAVTGMVGTASFELTNTEPSPPARPAGCASAGGAAFEDAVVYPAGFSLVGLPDGTRIPGASRLWGWWDQGGGGAYEARKADQPVTGGRGYWKYFSCPTAVSLSPTDDAGHIYPLGAYHASIVGNPTDRDVVVKGHGYAARYDPDLNDGAGGYEMSGYKQPVLLLPGEAIWVFSYLATTITVGTVR